MKDLKNLYIEPTSHCNLECVMCSRRNWKNETKGHMEVSLFDKIVNEIPNSVNRIFFGGVGEPLHHPGCDPYLYPGRRGQAETPRDRFGQRYLFCASAGGDP